MSGSREKLLSQNEDLVLEGLEETLEQAISQVYDSEEPGLNYRKNEMLGVDSSHVSYELNDEMSVDLAFSVEFMGKDLDGNEGFRTFEFRYFDGDFRGYRSMIDNISDQLGEENRFDSSEYALFEVS